MNDSRTRARTETITAEHAGRRIDNFLGSVIREAPRSLIYKLLRSGQVRVNGGRVRPGYRLAEADRVRIPPVMAHDPDRPHVPAGRLDALAADVAFEDDNYLVLAKPAGLACHAGSGLRYGAVEMLRLLRPAAPRIDLAHRLDRDTSGCLVFSKHLAALRVFHDALREGAVTKRYLALVRGRPDPGLDAIDAALGVARDARGERHTAYDADGKPARTLVEDRRPAGDHTLLTLRLETGRMHQIRAHAAHIGHPVGGDGRYGDAGFNAALGALGLDRLFLHATEIAFHDGTRAYRVAVPLPAALTAVLDALESGA